MNILYRRWAGSLALGDQEQGLRGIWWEKRRALIAFLRRKHTVTLASRPSRFSRGLWEYSPGYKKSDVLMLEFGPCHWVWNQDDIQETVKLVQAHKGPVVFLCDDPEMLYGCLEPRALRLLNQKNFSRWSLWLNTPLPQPDVQQRLPGCKVVDAHYAALIKPRPYGSFTRRAAVYMGRGGDGREALLEQIHTQVPIHVYGKQKEWTRIQVFDEPPSQVDRGNVYAQYPVSVCVTDREHKRLGWRTGRAYHSLLAGVPTLVEAEHPVLLKEFYGFYNPGECGDMYRALIKDDKARKTLFNSQVKRALGESKFAALETL